MNLTRRLRILLIEDNEDDYFLTQEMLEEMGSTRASLEWASTYSAGHLRLMEGDHDICLLDYQLGERTGLDLLREARAQGCRTPVVLLTVHDDHDTDLAVMDAGAADYLIKGEITARMLERSIRYARERERLLEEIRLLSLTDELTGLYNRRGFVTLGEQARRLAERSMAPLVLIYMDLDGMKQVNDQHGHKEGDQLLVDTARLLNGTFRKTDTVARIGGDEFVVLASDAPPPVVETIKRRLNTNLDATNAEPTRVHPIRLSTGFLTCDPLDSRPLDELLAEADAEMYQVKQTRNRCAEAEQQQGAA